MVRVKVIGTWVMDIFIPTFKKKKKAMGIWLTHSFACLSICLSPQVGIYWLGHILDTLHRVCFILSMTMMNMREPCWIFLAHLSWRLTRWAYSIARLRCASMRSHFQTWTSPEPAGQSWSNFICSIVWVGDWLHILLEQVSSKLWVPWQQIGPKDL